MQLSDFHFDLPDSLIAHYPLPTRSACRLLSLDGNSGQTQQGTFTDIVDFLQSGDLLVFNNTRVIPARVYGRKKSGGKIEMLIERVLDTHRAWVHIKASKSPKPGTAVILGEDESVTATVLSREESLFEVRFPDEVLLILDRIGHIPLPPYIDRPDAPCDRDDYQTVYNAVPGAVAAPTAGLHFDETLLTRLRRKGVESAFITLHVGAGTFQPVRVTDIKTHRMHSEYTQVSPDVVNAVLACKARGKRVIAVGTTSVRALESAALSDSDLIPFQGDTAIFIYPGFNFKVVDVLITNFHLPESTLLMLVSAFAGYEATRAAYQEAVDAQFRFFSYGDAMWITKKTNDNAVIPVETTA